MSSLFVDGTEIAEAKLFASLSSDAVFHPECYGCIWSRDGRYFAWSSGQRKITIIRGDSQQSKPCNPLEPKDVVTFDAGGPVHSLAFCYRRTNWKATSGTRRYSLGGQSKAVNQDVDDCDATLVTGLKNGRLRTWDAKTGSLKLELCDHTNAVTGLSFAPKGQPLLVSVSLDGTMKLWDMDDDGNMIKTLKTNSTALFDCCWSPDGATLATVGNYQSVHLWDMKTRKQIRRLEGHRNNVTKCDFSPDGTLLATSSYDSRVIIWNVQFGTALRYLEHCSPPLSAIYAGGANNSYVRGVSFSSDGYHVSTVCDDGYVRFWDVFQEDIPVQATGLENSLVCSFSPDGSLLAVGTRSGNVSVFVAPMQVASLQHLCRITIRCLLSNADVDSLICVPPPLRRFLQYTNQYSTQPISVCG